MQLLPRLPLVLLLLALLSPGRRSPSRSDGSIVRGEVQLLATVISTAPTQPLLLPLPQQLRQLLLAVLLQEVAQVCVARAACCCDELLGCPACLLEPTQGECWCRRTAHHYAPLLASLLSLALLLLLPLLQAWLRLLVLQAILPGLAQELPSLLRYRLQGLVLLQLRLKLHAVLGSRRVQAQHRCCLPLVLLLHVILQHPRLLVLRQNLAVPVVCLLLLLLLVERLCVADVACRMTWQQDTPPGEVCMAGFSAAGRVYWCESC